MSNLNLDYLHGYMKALNSQEGCNIHINENIVWMEFLLGSGHYQRKDCVSVPGASYTVWRKHCRSIMSREETVGTEVPWTFTTPRGGLLPSARL